MKLRPSFDTFFNVNLMDNGSLEAIANRLMRPWKNRHGFEWRVIRNGEYYRTFDYPPFHETIDKIRVFVAACIFTAAYFTLLIYDTQTAIRFLATFTLTPLLGVALKIISWLQKSVREKNFHYMQLKANEKKSLPAPLLEKSKETNLVNLDTIVVNRIDRLGNLPSVLKRVSFEYLTPKDLLKLKLTCKTQYQIITASTDYFNHKLIQNTFASKFLNHFGRDKITEILSKPSMSACIQDHDFLDCHKTLNTVRETHALEPVNSEKVCHFNPSYMEKQPFRWGKIGESIFLAFSYKYHQAFKQVYDFHHFSITYAGTDGISILTFNKNREGKIEIQVSPVVEKEPLRHNEDKILLNFDKINCFAIDQNALAIEDYLPRLLKGEPCGACTRNADGTIIEGPRTFLNTEGKAQSMVELAIL